MNTTKTDPLRQMLTAGKFEPWIRDITFPLFKNLREGFRIDFTYPITALIGANGTSKSTVLRALRGAPRGENLSLYWFSTETDRVVRWGSKTTADAAFFYRYGPTKGVVAEVLKTRVDSNKGPIGEYWETSRPVLAYGMQPLAELAEGESAPYRNKTRWDTIKKPVVYLDFRSLLSAFDKYFYHGDEANPAERKTFLQSRSSLLRRVRDEKLLSLEWHSKERLHVVRELSDVGLKAVSEILGREYSSIRLLEHSVYRRRAFSALLRAAEVDYTEAFAGSGEFAVIRLVDEILQAPKHALLLLDEPEVSLHPGAQTKLMEFLCEQAKDKLLQVVMATHSPTMIRHLPDDAIKVFEAIAGEVSLRSQGSSSDHAFDVIGEALGDVTKVYVEDALAAEVVKRALGFYGAHAVREKTHQIEVLPGGASTLKSFAGIPAGLMKLHKVKLVLDGDQRPVVPLRRSNEVPDAELETYLHSIFGKLSLPADGGSGTQAEAKKKTQRLDQAKQLLDWWHANVCYLPGSTPEAWLLDKLQQASGLDPKTTFEVMAQDHFSKPRVSSEEIFATQKHRLGSVSDFSEFEEVEQCLFPKKK